MGYVFQEVQDRGLHSNSRKRWKFKSLSFGKNGDEERKGHE